MNVRNLLIALLVILTQLHTSVAQTPPPPDARIGPPQFAHSTKLMYAAAGTSSMPDGSTLKWATFYYNCYGSLITRTSRLGVPFVLTMTLHALPFEGEQVEVPNPNDPNAVNFYMPSIPVYTKTVSVFISDRRRKSFVSDEMTVTLDLYRYSYGLGFESSSTVEDTSHYCVGAGILRFVYLPPIPIVGIDTFLPNVNRP